jgi:uncharacterized protein (TIGR02172 family)
MLDMKTSKSDNEIILSFEGEINSTNAEGVEKEVFEALGSNPPEQVTFNFKDLTYISSAGLRILLKVKQLCPSLRLVEVSNEVYSVLEMTGFVTMIAVDRALTEIDITGCEKIGDGYTCEVYRLSPEMIVKVFKEGIDLNDIQRELNLAKQAFVLGIPTAISFDIVKVGDRYGVRFELFASGSLRDAFRDEPDRFDELVQLYAGLLKKINETVPTTNDLPSADDLAMEKTKSAKEGLTEEEFAKLQKLIGEIPHAKTYVHGDCHFKNILMQNGDLFLIDMDTLSVGNPIYELAAIYCTYIAFEEGNPGNSEVFLGVTKALSERVFDSTLLAYLGKNDEETYWKIRVVAYNHMCYWVKKYAPENKTFYANCASRLKEALQHVDSCLL